MDNDDSSPYPEFAAACRRASVRDVLSTGMPLVQRTVGGAKGLLMARHGDSDRQAFAALVRAPQHHNRKLRDIATDLVARAQADRR